MFDGVSCFPLFCLLFVVVVLVCSVVMIFFSLCSGSCFLDSVCCRCCCLLHYRFHCSLVVVVVVVVLLLSYLPFWSAFFSFVPVIDFIVLVVTANSMVVFVAVVCFRLRSGRCFGSSSNCCVLCCRCRCCSLSDWSLCAIE